MHEALGRVLELLSQTPEASTALTSMSVHEVLDALDMLADSWDVGASADEQQQRIAGGLIESLSLRPAGIAHAARWLEREWAHFEPVRLHRFANRVAWITRGNLVVEHDWDGTERSRWEAWLKLERLRFAFDAQGMARLLDRLPSEAVRGDGLLTSLRAFCTIRNARDTLEASAAIDEALGHPQNRGELPEGHDHGAAAFDIVAHAVWLNFRLPQQGELLVSVSERAIAAAGGQASPVMLFRRATGLRLLGRYEEGVDNVEVALSRLRGDTEFVRTFSEQLVRERELCLAGRFTQEKNADELVVLKEQVEDIDRKSIVRIIEIVTLFTAVVAFALGGGSIAANSSRSAGDTLLVIGGFGSTLIMFSVAVYSLLEISLGVRTTPRRLALMGAVAVGIAGLQFGGLALVARVLG